MLTLYMYISYCYRYKTMDVLLYRKYQFIHFSIFVSHQILLLPWNLSRNTSTLHGAS
jgi:hypothetical protein